MGTIYDEYEAYTKKYQAEYGPKTLVLQQVGSFYEIYSADDGLVDMKEVGDMLNIVVSRKNKSILEINRTNHLMAGFPLYTLRKFMNVLVNNSYTVVLVEQVTPPPNPKRAVTQVVSPGTRLDDIEVNDTNNMMSIYFEEIKDWKTSKDIMFVGVSVIDLSTGCSRVGEMCSAINDYYYALDEVYRLVTVYNPREVLLFGKRSSTDVFSYLELGNRYVHNKINAYSKEVLNLSYQAQLLSKVFKGSGLLTIHEHLGLENKMYAAASYVALLQFSYQHNEHILEKIRRPEHISSDNGFVLSYNSARQLNIVSNDASKKSQSLVGMLNTCSTAMGRRSFKERLLSPVTDPIKIEAMYDKVDMLLRDGLFKKTDKHLANIYDLERLYRRLSIGKLNPADFSSIDTSFSNICSLFEVFGEVEGAMSFVEHYKNVIDLEEAPKHHIDNIAGSFFKKGLYEDIDKMHKDLNELLGFFDALAICLNENNEGFYKVDYNERDGYHLSVTPKRYNDSKKRLSKRCFDLCGYQVCFDDITTKPQNTCLKLFHECFDEVNSRISDYKKALSCAVTERYMSFLEEIVDKYEKMFGAVISYVCDIDYYTCCAKNADVQRYRRPKIQNAEKPFVRAKNLRHPIVERISTSIEYIGNDIEIGRNGCDGMLLYGVNSSGKSTISKSIAIALVMAQAGMFVACDEMVYKPYRQVFTRIPTGDDLFKGLSTFSVEICELRNILKRADDHSLVVGDEVASGTEQVSGLSIVSASIIQLCERKASFVFATHLHDLTKIQRVVSLENLRLYHLSVQCVDGKLVYDRKLKEGQGSTIYGIEVCKSLDMGPEFLNLANDIRQGIMELPREILDTKKCRYNFKKYVDCCDICKGKATEVHHINEQNKADKDGYIGRMHKNVFYNLMNVCEKCHGMIHAGKIYVKGFVQTSEGIELDVVNIPGVAASCRQAGMSQQQVVEFMQETHGISITKYKLSKICV